MSSLLLALNNSGSSCVGRYLAERGYSVETAANGLECLAKLRDRTFDVIVIEKNLPWGGGDGVLARMKEEQRMTATAVLFIDADPVCSCEELSIVNLTKLSIVNLTKKPDQLHGWVDGIQHAMRRRREAIAGLEGEDVLHFAPKHIQNGIAATIGN